MLVALPPEALAEARAAYEVIPLGDGWRQADTIAGEIKEEFAWYRAMKSGKREIPKEWRYKPGEFIPSLHFEKEHGIKVNQQSIDIFQAVIESRFGVY